VFFSLKEYNDANVEAFKNPESYEKAQYIYTILPQIVILPGGNIKRRGNN
jgi:hypothetical protein